MSNFSNIKSMALDKAREAIHQGRPVAAREWTEVAAVADAAAHGVYPGIQPDEIWQKQVEAGLIDVR